MRSSSEVYARFFEVLCRVYDAFEQDQAIGLQDFGFEFQAFEELSEIDRVSLFTLRSVDRTTRALPQIGTNTALMLSAWLKGLRIPAEICREIALAGALHPLTLTAVRGGDSKSAERSYRSIKSIQVLSKMLPLSDLQKLILLEWPIPFGDNGTYRIYDHLMYQHFGSRMLRIAASFQQFLVTDPGLSAESVVAKVSSSGLGCDQSLVRILIQWLAVHLKWSA